MELSGLTAERERLNLTADCANCFGLCCVAHGFRASESFALDKLPGKPCPNLLADFGCGIYRTLRPKGFSGCTAYTCYGAGQKVAQDFFGGTDWQQAPETAQSMFHTFHMVRQLHQLLWFITEALDRCPAGATQVDLLAQREWTERMAATPADELSWGAVDDHCMATESLLGQVSAGIRAAARPAGRAELQGVNLRAANFQGADLRGADLWGAVLSSADLSGADLRCADLMGADLGRANLGGADLSAAIFLTQSQLELAHGNARTTLSHPLQRPAHWSGAADNV
jgi:uncharacterized protein YjbI with pentapeptide repeats